MEITTLLLILKFVLVIGVLAFIHELGHFLLSKAFKIEVEEFGFGFPPRLAKLFKWGETEFTLNWIPFGAFVRPKGENDPEVEGGLASASPGARLAVLFAGPVFNLVLSVILFSIMFTRIGAYDLSQVIIVDVSDGSPAQQAGLLPGDIVNDINGNSIDSINKLSSIVKENIGQEISVGYLREEKLQTIKITPRIDYPSDQGPLGIGISNPVKDVNFFQAVPFGFLMIYEQAKQLILLPGNIASGLISPDEARMVGPVGMYSIYNDAVQKDAERQQTSDFNDNANELLILAMISAAFGIFNLLPLPALDGGRIIFVLPEIFFKKRVPAKYENMVHFIGFAALIMLSFFITFQDIVNPIQLP